VTNEYKRTMDTIRQNSKKVISWSLMLLQRPNPQAGPGWRSRCVAQQPHRGCAGSSLHILHMLVAGWAR
jgi:hypothetical protein